MFDNSEFLKSKFKNHETLKLKILESIASMGRRQLTQIDTYANISNSDWSVQNQTYDRPYLSLIKPSMIFFCEEISEYFFKKKFNVHMVSVWFQQYNKGDEHKIHLHSGCNFTGIYYLELQEKKDATIFFDRRLKEYALDVSEGDIVCFPSYLMHKSEVKSDKRKTVIAFNINVK